jgi:transportin-3
MDRAALLEALRVLYAPDHGNDPAKEHAQHILQHWQQSQDAWYLADAVLHDPASPFEAHLFCAQTLRTKVRAMT